MIQDALVGAYLNERSLPTRTQAAARDPHARDRERRRRDLAAQMVRRLCDGAVRGEDGTVTWISPSSPRGVVDQGAARRPLHRAGRGGADARGVCDRGAGRAGGGGAGRRRDVPGALRVLVGTEDRTPTPSPGAFSGAASQVWTWLALHRVLGEDWLLERAADGACCSRRADWLRTTSRWTSSTGRQARSSPAQPGRGDWAGPLARRRRAHRPPTDRAGHPRRERRPLNDPAQPRGHRRLRPRRHRHRLGADPARARRRGFRGRAARLEPPRRAGLRLPGVLYQPEHGNWLDVRIGAEEDFFTSWCHGSAGWASACSTSTGARAIPPTSTWPVGPHVPAPPRASAGAIPCATATSASGNSSRPWTSATPPTSTPKSSPASSNAARSAAWPARRSRPASCPASQGTSHPPAHAPRGHPAESLLLD